MYVCDKHKVHHALYMYMLWIIGAFLVHVVFHDYHA